MVPLQRATTAIVAGLAMLVPAVVVASQGSSDGFARAVEPSHFCLPGTTPADLDTLFDSEPGGVVGADYQRAYPLDDGRVLWLFQDGAVRSGPDSINIVHNLAMLQDGACFDVMYGGTRASPRPFLFASATDPFQRWFWPLDAELGDDGLLYIFTTQMVELGESYLTHVQPVSTNVAVFDPTTNTVVSEALPGNSSADLYGWAITSDHTWTYLYAQCYRQFGYDEYAIVDAFDQLCSTRVTVGRVPRGHLLDAPDYWDGANWQPDESRAVPVITTSGRLINANQIEWTGSSFFSVNKEGDWWGSTIYFSRAERAQGPFTIYNQVGAPIKCTDCNSFFASWIPRQAVDVGPGAHVFGLAHNRWDGVVSSFYRPSFHVVAAPPLLAAGDEIVFELPESYDMAVINVTTVRPDVRGHVTLYPCADGRPNVSALNHEEDVIAGNLTMVRPDVDGRVCVFSLALTDIVVDMAGGFVFGEGDDGDMAQERLADTRFSGDRLASDGVLRVVVPGTPSSVVVNVTAVLPDSPGYITVFPCDRDRPLTANVNYEPGDVIGNMAASRVGESGEICLYSKAATDLVVDLTASFESDHLVPEDNPRRLLDTRELGSKVRPGDVVTVTVPEGLDSVLLNVTSVGAETAGFVTAFACGGDRPVTSSLNYAAGTIEGNMAVVQPNETGEVCLYTKSATDLVVDLAGGFPADGSFVPEPTPIRLVDTRLELGVLR